MSLIFASKRNREFQVRGSKLLGRAGRLDIHAGFQFIKTRDPTLESRPVKGSKSCLVVISTRTGTGVANPGDSVVSFRGIYRFCSNAKL